MIYLTRRARIEAEKIQRRGRRMRSMKLGVAGFATFAGVSVASIAPANADHTVESGDTLSKIAAKYDGVTVSSLMESNGLSSHLIYPGQNLSFTESSSSGSSSASTASSTSGSHTVVSGDTLGAIAAQHGTTVSALKSANNLNSHWIYPGDKLTIPGSSSASTASTSSSRPAAPAAPAASSTSGSHTVASGDTLGAIASQHGVSVSALMSANNLNSHMIYPGNQLTIPGSNGSSSSSSSSAASSSSSSSSTSIDSSNSSRVSTSSASTASASTSGASWAANTANGGGATYRYGANGAGGQYDCSSFSQAALAKDGKSIPRTSSAQYASAQKISAGQLQAGDLVFYGSGRVTHVAVYVGGGQIAHARNPSAGVTTNDMASYNQYNNVVGYGRY